MAKTLSKNLHLCFSLIKRPHPRLTTSTTTPTTTNHHPPPPTSIITTYNSLYEDRNPTTATTSSDTDMAEAEAEVPTTPDLTAAYASRRFFISSPGRSNSIVDSLSLSGLDEEEEEEVVAGGVAVHTYSPDPYTDFRRSMEDMVAARELKRVEDAWEYLQELLLSYLALNPKTTHKYIVGAFADLVLSLMSNNNNNNNNNDNNNNCNYRNEVIKSKAEVGSSSSSSSSSSSMSLSSSASCGGGEIMSDI